MLKLLTRLRNGETTELDWKQLLARQPSQVENIKCFEGVTRLYYSNDVAKGARVMHTMNLWPSVGLCNGSTGSVVHIIYEPYTQPPSLPVAVIVKFDSFSGSSFTYNKPSCVPIPPVTSTVQRGNVVHERQQLP